MNLNQFLTLVENLVVLSRITDSFGQVTASTYLRCAGLVIESSIVGYKDTTKDVGPDGA
jgi:hypothetical protein